MDEHPCGAANGICQFCLIRDAAAARLRLCPTAKGSGIRIFRETPTLQRPVHHLPHNPGRRHRTIAHWHYTPGARRRILKRGFGFRINRLRLNAKRRQERQCVRQGCRRRR